MNQYVPLQLLFISFIYPKLLIMLNHYLCQIIFLSNHNEVTVKNTRKFKRQNI